MKRYLWALLLILFAASVSAQETLDVLVIHDTAGEATQLAIADIDSISFSVAAGHEDDGFSMLVHQHDAATPLAFPIATIEWMDFATVAETELYEAVDLGLTVRWATFNVGATAPEQYGDFFAWGETATKNAYSEATYTYYNKDVYEFIGTNICGTPYDVARQAWGGRWRLPTRSEIADLTTKCSWTAETLNGVAGYRVVGPSGNSIFLPATGYMDGTEVKERTSGGFYWSGNIDRSMTSAAYNLNFRGYDAQWSAPRCYGFAVRAVR